VAIFDGILDHGKGHRHLPLQLVLDTDHRDFGDGGVVLDRLFDFARA
jgi:hypothetical protein